MLRIENEVRLGRNHDRRNPQDDATPISDPLATEPNGSIGRRRVPTRQRTEVHRFDDAFVELGEGCYEVGRRIVDVDKRAEIFQRRQRERPGCVYGTDASPVPPLPVPCRAVSVVCPRRWVSVHSATQSPSSDQATPPYSIRSSADNTSRVPISVRRRLTGLRPPSDGTSRRIQRSPFSTSPKAWTARAIMSKSRYARSDSAASNCSRFAILRDIVRSEVPTMSPMSSDVIPDAAANSRTTVAGKPASITADAGTPAGTSRPAPRRMFAGLRSSCKNISSRGKATRTRTVSLKALNVTRYVPRRAIRNRADPVLPLPV